MPTETVIFDDTYFRDPHQFYRDVHRRGPIHRFVSPVGVRGWLVTSQTLAHGVLTDPRIGKGRDTMLGVSAASGADVGWRSRLLRYGTEWVVTHMLAADPPDHARLRRAAADRFSPPAVDALVPRIEAFASELVDAIDPSGPVDLVPALACPLPVAVICSITGISPRHEHRIERSSAVLSDVTVAEAAELRWASADFARLIVPHFAARRLRPREDLITDLVRSAEVNLKEGLSTVALLLIAGHETTSNLILGALLALLRRPEEFARVRADPARLGAVIDETLRTDPPLPVATLRQAHTDLDLAGHRIARGELLMVSLLAANLDPQNSSGTEPFDPDRPARHMSFGAGIHHCLGARLARAEAVTALRCLLNRYQHLSLAAPIETLRWRRSIFFRRLESLPVHLSL
ncbi:cytochrome P450 [Nocardia sp. NPDC004068]|uniref:cytochrome P450 n=1 Tax=Nocardia sp. NPDC004068 TaxID=3364303 RepID=UPI00367A95C8